ncbi:hypothetical protein [Paraburkholderia terrae]|uniref:Uncharacterized protein n=1 Tax=Paraburkholderia terrae TaxID=311230 RepID=A0A2I8EVT8_9BURK|nr:hypothetical protein [Paraburkholderia terrae]AUT62904.1 hypothetical protein C2L65_25375 [Paraburkholderia terrae]
MSTFARIAANRLRNMACPLTEHERLSIANLIDILSNDVGRCHTCLQQMAKLMGDDFQAGTDLTIVLPVQLAALLNGEDR